MAESLEWPRMKILDVPQSGSVAGQTSSRNRFGQYRRTRATPVNPNTGFQGVVRARLAVNAAAWRALTGAQRAAWGSLGTMITRTDALGQVYGLTGFQAYLSVNNNNLAAGNAVVPDAPLLLTPAAISTATVTLTSAAFSIAFTTTPLGAGERLFAYTSMQRSAGRGFEGDMRLVAISAAALASPMDIHAAYLARFGTRIAGQRIFITLQRYVGGFLSGPLLISQLVA